MTKLKATQLPEVRKAIVESQKRYCPLCLKRWSTKVTTDQCVDHNHTTGRIRGVLCRNCNHMEGKVNTAAVRAKRDGSSLAWLERLVAYLQKHESRPLPYTHPRHKSDDEKRLLRNKQARIRRARAKKEAWWDG